MNRDSNFSREDSNNNERAPCMVRRTGKRGCLKRQSDESRWGKVVSFRQVIRPKFALSFETFFSKANWEVDWKIMGRGPLPK